MKQTFRKFEWIAAMAVLASIGLVSIAVAQDAKWRRPFRSNLKSNAVPFQGPTSDALKHGAAINQPKQSVPLNKLRKLPSSGQLKPGINSFKPLGGSKPSDASSQGGKLAPVTKTPKSNGPNTIKTPGFSKSPVLRPASPRKPGSGQGSFTPGNVLKSKPWQQDPSAAKPWTDLGNLNLDDVRVRINEPILEQLPGAGGGAPPNPGNPPGGPGNAQERPWWARWGQPGIPPAEQGDPPVDPGNPQERPWWARWGQPGIPPVEQGNPPGDPGNPPAEQGDPPVDPGNPPADPGNPPHENPPGGNPPAGNPWPILWPIIAGGNLGGGNLGGGPVYVPGGPQEFFEQAAAVHEQAYAAVDLILEDVQYVEPATLLVGPAYRVKYRNQGPGSVGTFRVALVAAMDGYADEHSPYAAVEVDGLAGGQTGEVTIRLPRAAMRLVGGDGRTSAFTDLLVAVDFDNVVIESDKINNIAIIERTALEEAAQ